MSNRLLEATKWTCTFKKDNGELCKRSVSAGEGRCWQHATSLRHRFGSLTRNQTLLFLLALLGLIVGVLALPDVYSFIFHSSKTPQVQQTDQLALSTSKEQFRIDQRPYVWVSEQLGPFIRAPHSTGNTSDKLAFQFKIKNNGKSPAIHCQVDARIAIGENAWKKIVWKSLDADKGSILPPGNVEFNDAFSDQAVSEEFFKQVISPGIMEPIEVLGHIQYFGTDGTPYSSDFCFGRTPALGLYNCPYHNDTK